jgi:hypothetical protein
MKEMEFLGHLHHHLKMVANSGRLKPTLGIPVANDLAFLPTLI